MLERRNLEIKSLLLASPTKCLVCGESCNHAQVLTTSHLRNAYESYFRVDCPENTVPENITLVKCNQCELEFCLEPKVPVDFYPWVVELPGYYPTDRPEWNLLLAEFASAGRHVNVLEAGCGSGVFLKKMANVQNVMAYGIDTSESAIRQCKHQDLNAVASDLGTYLKSPPANFPKKFDFIVGSHVLEHVANPFEFLSDCLNLLVPAGSVFMSLPLSPNDHEHAMLDPILYPPHHLTRWRKKTFLALGEILNAKVTLRSVKRRSALRALSHTMFCALKFRGLNVSIGSRLKLLLREPLYWGSEAAWQVLRRARGSIVSDHILLKLTK